NFPSTITTSTKITSVQSAFPRSPANGLSAPSSAAYTGSAASVTSATVNSFFIASRFEVGTETRTTPRPRNPLCLQHRQHADDDGKQGRTFDHGGRDDHRRLNLAGPRRLPRQPPPRR